MARNRTISPDFWTWEAVIDCALMTRLLFIGLWNFADDGGVQPLRPRTIRMQVFPGDDLDNERVRAMIDELVACKLVRIFEVESQEYLSIIDWEQIQSVGRRVKRRYPGDPAKPPPVEQAAPASVAEAATEPKILARWRKVIGKKLSRNWPDGPPADTEIWIAKWLAEGYDLERDVLPAIGAACRPSAGRDLPSGLQAVASVLAANRAPRAMGGGAAGHEGPHTVHAAP